MPSGTSMRIGWEYPRARSSCLPLRLALKPTPWISSSLEKPTVTPLTMLAMIERAVPYMALAKRVSPMGATITFLSVIVIVTTGAKVLSTLPLGPSTRTVVSLMSTLTLSGMGTGCFPMRLMVGGSLPDVADQFATGLVAAAVGVLHQAL